MPKTIMLATLAGQPQVVTFALDALLQKGEPISEVILLHLDPQDARLQNSLTKLQKEFHQDQYYGHRCRLRRIPLKLGDRTLDDIRDDAEANAVSKAILALLSELKSTDTKLHLCISGGRRMVALLVLSAAALLCDHHDRLWHMYTPDEFQDAARHGAILHAQPGDGVQMIQVPLVPWGAYFPGLRAMAQAPQEAVAAQMGWLRESEQQCEQVYAKLTDRQREVLLAFAQGGTPQDVAEELTITMATVNTHKTTILDECRNAWALDPDERLDYHFLREKFGPFVGRMDQG